MPAAVVIAKQFRLEAAHFLPNHGGKCQRMHGHSYRVELSLAGTPHPADGSPSEGMVRDYGDVSAAWLLIHQRLDHRCLNDELPDDFMPSTAENLARFIAAELAPVLDELVAVRVWETATSWALVEVER